MPASSCCPIPFDAVPCKIQVNFDYGCSSSPSSSSSPSGSSGSSGSSSPGDSSIPSGSSGSSGPSGSSGSGQSSCSSSCPGCCGVPCGTCDNIPKTLFVTISDSGCSQLDTSYEMTWNGGLWIGVTTYDCEGEIITVTASCFCNFENIQIEIEVVGEVTGQIASINADETPTQCSPFMENGIAFTQFFIGSGATCLCPLSKFGTCSFVITE